MIPPPEVRFARILLLLLIIWGFAQLFFGMHLVNVFLFLILGVISIPILRGVNRRMRFSLWASITFFILLGLPSAIYLCTTVPWYVRDSFTHPERSSLVPDAIMPGVSSLALVLPFWLCAALLLRNRSRAWFRTESQEIPNKTPQVTGH